MVHRDEHLDEVVPLREEIFWLVEETMPQSTAYQHTEEDVEEQWVELFIRNLLLLVELAHEQIAQEQAQHPASGIISYGDRTQLQQDRARVPNDIVEQICHHIDILLWECQAAAWHSELYIEAEVHDVAILYHIVLALDAELTSLADSGF